MFFMLLLNDLHSVLMYKEIKRIKATIFSVYIVSIL